MCPDGSLCSTWTRFPGQNSGDSRIPSILWYTKQGEVFRVGAEARENSALEVADDEDMFYVEW